MSEQKKNKLKTGSTRREILREVYGRSYGRSHMRSFKLIRFTTP